MQADKIEYLPNKHPSSVRACGGSSGGRRRVVEFTSQMAAIPFQWDLEVVLCTLKACVTPTQVAGLLELNT